MLRIEILQLFDSENLFCCVFKRVSLFFLVCGILSGCTNPYGKTKYFIEQICWDFAAANPVRVITEYYQFEIVT